MATYTMQLREYIEQVTQYEEGLSWKERIEVGREKLFDFHYPIYDEDYRKVFETNFIRKFYMREIGFETEGLFKFQLETWLNINMPYFNNLFESELIEYDPLMNASMQTIRDTTSNKDQTDNRNVLQNSTTEGQTTSNMEQDSISSGENKDDNFSRKVESDNPDSRLQLQTEEGKGVIEYASGIDENKTDNTRSTSGEANTKTDATDTSNVSSNADQSDNLKSNVDEVENFIEKRVGKIGIHSNSQLIKEYREALLRVEIQIHKEMQELFMLVY